MVSYLGVDFGSRFINPKDIFARPTHTIMLRANAVKICCVLSDNHVHVCVCVCGAHVCLRVCAFILNVNDQAHVAWRGRGMADNCNHETSWWILAPVG